MAISEEDIGHEVGDPDALWDLRGTLVSLSSPGPYGSMCVIRLVNSGKLFDVGSIGLERTFGKPVFRSQENELRRIAKEGLSNSIRRFETLFRESADSNNPKMLAYKKVYKNLQESMAMLQKSEMFWPL